MIVYKLKDIIDSQYNRPDEKRHQRSILFLIENVKTGGQSVFKIDRISKHTCSLICNTKACGHRLTIEHDIPTVASGKYRGRCIAPTVGKEEMMNRSNWLKVFHSHTAKCKMTGPSVCDKTEHAFNVCQTTDGKIIKRKFRSFVVREKVENPHIPATEIITDADRLLETKVNRTTKLEKDPEYKTNECGIDDSLEMRAMNRAQMVSHGAARFDPQYDHQIENRLRSLPRSNGSEERFIWEEKNFIYYGLAKDLMLIHNQTASLDGTFDDVNALKVKKKKVWSQLYIITKLNKNDKGDRTFSEPVAFCLMKKRRIEDYLELFQFMKRIFKQEFPESVRMI